MVGASAAGTKHEILEGEALDMDRRSRVHLEIAMSGVRRAGLVVQASAARRGRA